LGKSFRLMFDGVINHMSAQGEWFRKFLQDEEPYKDYFVTVEGTPDLSHVVRPRALPLLTEFETCRWQDAKCGRPSAPTRLTSTLQIPMSCSKSSISFSCMPRRGAQFIRLDAIAYLWKEIGTTCIHLPQTHAVIQLLRAVFDEVAPHVRLITETNVPHRITSPISATARTRLSSCTTLRSRRSCFTPFRTGDASVLSGWASNLTLPSDRTTFFNFLASHDGVGLNPARGILSSADIDSLTERTLTHGGLISHKQNADGSTSPYEMNINYFDALSNPSSDEPLDLQVDRFMAAQAIMLTILGIPGIYFHSLFGSRNWKEGVNITKHNRTINRQKLERDELEEQLADANSLRSKVFTRYRKLLAARSSASAFDPHGGQKVLDWRKGYLPFANIPR
jgi:glucosylglycerate phosphorylase